MLHDNLTLACSQDTELVKEREGRGGDGRGGEEREEEVRRGRGGEKMSPGSALGTGQSCHHTSDKCLIPLKPDILHIPFFTVEH